MPGNLPVAPRIDLLRYRADSLGIEVRMAVAEDDAYLGALGADYERGILDLVKPLSSPIGSRRPI
jgi:predicted proteasome-type protease